MKLDYEGLFVLAAVVRSGSFDAAATTLGVTQSAVSQRIKQMEERLGATLIVRGRPSKPTNEGLLLCQHLEYVALLEAEVFDRFDGVGSEKTGPVIVRVSVNNDSLATWFPSVIQRLADETSICLEIIADDQEFTEDRLRSGDALAVVTSSNEPIPGSRNVRLGRMEYMAVCTVDFFEKHFGDGVSMSSLFAAPNITFDRKDSLPSSWMMLSFKESITAETNFVPSFEGHLICCQKGIGWAMMPTMSVERFVAKGELRELIPNRRVSVPLYWQMRNQSSALLQKISRTVEEVAKELLLEP